MKALAAGRRHRLAPVVLMTLALLFTGALYAAFAPSSAQADTATADDVAEGERLFITNCSTCHGLDAEGMDTAPSLIGVGAASVHFQIVTGRMPMDANSPQAMAKPPQLTEEQARQVAAYIASLGPGPTIPSEEQVDPALGDAAVGGQLFRTNCAMCHNAVGAGGALTDGKHAPALYDSTPTEIYEAMLTGPQSMPVFNDVNLTSEEKRDIIAYLYEQREPNPGGLSLGSIGPVSEGLWVFVVGIGVLIGAAVWIGARSS
ncbi:cytochrome bc1 complex diheme cytochrome c subunit [Ruania halotolerans]|uniref:cytochrome bc1 complex diheme cytochrome c subunit n=1 Tax=Ruania halotolerans TaxID=2897773 RepID=UPI001E3EA6EE|nr:c-type cytochrome [Ruania halotolerans]UFU04833.1 c-type cytochrome [Ruania halotolerans]